VVVSSPIRLAAVPGLAVLGLVLSSTAFVHAGDDWTRTREYRYLMGTSVEVEAYGGDDHGRREAIETAFGAIAEVDRLMSNYRDDSELTLINRTAAHEAVRVSDPMLAVLALAEHVSQRSHGAFDVTVGPLVRLWGFHDKRPHLPSPDEFSRVRPLVDYRQVLIDRTSHRVRFARPGIEIDLGGIAKGFAVEIAANVLRQRGLSGFIDAGGNQYLLGTPPGQRSWNVGIKDPERPGRLLGVVDTRETSVSTSADYSTFVEINGQRFGHVLDPRTLRPSDQSLSVTILARDGTLADALSKAVFILGPSEGLKLVDSFEQTSAIVAYRKPSGSVALAMSISLKSAFHPTTP
jgi:thiamine biosynthesis lipoprotein